MGEMGDTFSSLGLILNSLYSLETSAFEELRSEFINLACNCVINTLRLIVYLTGFSIRI